MKFNQVIEKVDVEKFLGYEYLVFNIDDEQEIKFSYGTKYWLLNGKLHRTDGPAIECSSGDKFWYLNGIQYSEKEFNEKVKK